jgi:hypothetical protein
MPLLIPFASTLSEAGRHAFRDLALPNLARVLAATRPAERWVGDEYSLTPPHERALAGLWGWHGEDGALPFAALHACADGIDVAGHAWGELTPAHWHVGRDHVSLAAPDALALSDDDSRRLFDAVRPLFESEGWVLAWGAATRWYAAHPTLAGLPCASLDRVIGRNVDLWLPAHPGARLVRRLQNEVQMFLYRFPMNDEREARDALPVNSFWLSGCGPAQPVRTDAAVEVEVDDRLRAPALAEDWAAWAEAWRALDAGPLARIAQRAARGDAISLILCGERQAERQDTTAVSLWQRVTRPWRAAPLHERLESL